MTWNLRTDGRARGYAATCRCSRWNRRAENFGIAVDHHRSALCFGDHLSSNHAVLARELSRTSFGPNRHCDGGPNDT